MKKRSINFSWPAILSDFAQDTVQENFSRGKLKVFYRGETADHRFFSDSFSEELVKSLPYTPVVSYYDEEKEDFVGHATEQQILGIVDPCIAPSFVEDDEGKTWCICDVVLYTERPDKVGDLAKKVVGHKQSLELDPSSVKYTINYDEKKHFKNIEFTAGRFVGVSVLGNDQQPAFSGSAFFAYNENFEAKMKLLREYCETKTDSIQSGGNEMNLQEFMKLSWGDISSKVEQTISKEYANDAFTYIVDMFEDSAIVRFYYYIGGDCKLMRVKYSCAENGDITLGDVNEVHITYEDIKVDSTEEIFTEETTGVTQTNLASIEEEEEKEEPNSEDPIDDKEEKDEDSFADSDDKEDEDDSTDESTDSDDDEEDKDDEKVFVDEEKEEVDEEDKVEEDKEEFVDAACDGGAAEPVEAAQVVNAEVTPDDKKVSVEDEATEETSSGSTSFTQSERAELETLKREKKIALVDSYKEDLSEEDIEDFMSKIDSFEIKDLEIELLKAYKNRSVKKPMRAFAFAPTKNAHHNENSLDALVRKNLRK